METQKRLFDDSMFKLEHVSDDKDTAESEKPRLVKLYARNESTWADDYSANCRLRQEFRVSFTILFLISNIIKVQLVMNICLLKSFKNFNIVLNF